MTPFFAPVGSALILIGWLAYLALIRPEKVPKRPLLHTALIGIGMILLILSRNYSVGVIILFLFGALFFYLLTISSLPDGELKVRVGDVIIPFKSVDSEGVGWETAVLQNQRILLKFFRGHW